MLGTYFLDYKPECWRSRLSLFVWRCVCNEMEWEGIQFLTFPTIWCPTEGAQGHMTHKDFTEHSQTTGSSR